MSGSEPPALNAAKPNGAPVLQRMAEAHRFGKHDRILCYGCGSGEEVHWFRARKYHVVGYDPHPPFGFSELPKGKFEYVFLIHLMTGLKTTENRRAALARAAHYVRPGGHLVIVTRIGTPLAEETGLDGPDGAIAYFQRLLDGCRMDTAAVSPGFETAGQSLCLMFRKGGVYQPRLPIVWIDTPDALRETARRLNAEPRLALDVETTLGEPKAICTIQLGTPEATYIIDALALRELRPVKELMENPGIEKLIHNAQFETRMFAQYGIRIHNVYDTLIVSRKKYRKGAEGGHKLDDVCERELGIYLDKSLQTSDWTRRPLSPEQLAYAAVDAEVLLALHRAFEPPKPPETLPLF